MNDDVIHVQPHCAECGRKLIKFKTESDWSRRSMHRQCYKRKQHDVYFELLLRK